MSNKKYSIGIDYGTLSGRAVLVDLNNGETVATEVKNYTHAVMDEFLPDGKTRLPHDFALQYPNDYIEVIEYTVPSVIRQSGVDPEDIIGLAIDFTACTMLPVDKSGRPLCEYSEYSSNPNAYVKLWKHHAAQAQADKLNRIAKERNDSFMDRYGGKISSEWMIPKIMQICDEAPDIFDNTDMFMEAADWVIFMLTGNVARNSCTAGYKSLWSKKEGYPSHDFYAALDPKLTNITDTKLRGKIYSLGDRAGGLTAKMASVTGLQEGMAVAVANVDAHVAVPAVGITEAGAMLMNIGTSTCHMVLSDRERIVPGMCGVVEDGIIPGLFGYEAGQSCVGDHFDWFVHNCVPEKYYKAAAEHNMNIHSYLTMKAEALKVGESGLIALDWWNGNRSVLVDVDLTGMILGCTLLTKPEEIYRALIEATAFGTKMIIDTFEGNDIPINELYACGGISRKNSFMMQVYADVTGKEIRISATEQTAALGSAMFGAVAAGKANGGFDTIREAANKLANSEKKVYKPIAENTAVYAKLYEEYKILHDYFGRGANDVMKRLKKMKG